MTSKKNSFKFFFIIPKLERLFLWGGNKMVVPPMLPWGEARIKLPWVATSQMFDKQV
jgi:hypothetical protein